MTSILLTPEQAAIFESATTPVRMYLPDGSIAGWVSSTLRFPPQEPTFTPEEIAEAEKRVDSPGPWHTMQEVLESLREVERP